MGEESEGEMGGQEGIQVLIVEDDPSVGEIFQGFLEELSYQVVGIALDGVQALEMVQALRPDVILMDIALPDTSGIEVTRQIQSCCPTPVVIVTAYDSSELVTQASEAGAAAYVVKPTDIREMERAISIAIARFADLMKVWRLNAALHEREQQFRTIADFTYDWESWIGPDGTPLYVSPSCERITGYGPDAFMKDVTLFEEIVHPDDRARVAGHFHDPPDRSQADVIDYRIVTATGETRWIGHVCQSVYAEDGSWLGRRISDRDITKRKRAEKALEESERKYRELVDLLPQPVFELDVQGRFVFVNQSALDTFGYTREDFEQRLDFSQLFAPADRARARQHVRLVLEGRRVAGNSYTALKRGGSVFPVMIFFGLITREGEATGLRVVVANATWF